MRNALCWYAGVAGAALMMAGGQAHAQAGEAPVPRVAPAAGEIIVTAQKREESINDVGLTIQAATGEQLAQRGITEVSDLSKLVAGFTATQSTFATPVYTLRGIGLFDASIGAAPAVAIYTDQVPRNFPVMSDALELDIERVEVLKGPQGTLFGQSSTGGAINYIVGKPTDSFEAGFKASYERFDRADISGFVSGPLAENLAGRLAVRGITGGAYQYSVTRPDDRNGDVRKIMGRLSLDWTPTDRIQIQTRLTGARDRSDTLAYQYRGSFYNIYSEEALAAANADPATRNPFGYVDNDLYALLTTPGSPGFDATFQPFQDKIVRRMNGVDSFNTFRPEVADGAMALLGTPVVRSPRAAEWTPGFLRGSRDWYAQGTLRADVELSDAITLTSISAYAEKKVDRTVDLDGTRASSLNIPTFGKIEAFNQEVRLAGDMDRLRWIVGANYDNLKTADNNDYILFDFTGNDPIAFAATGVGPILDTRNLFNTKMETYAFFGNLEFEVTEALNLSGGLRYTKNKQDATYCYNDPAGTFQGTNRVFEVLTAVIGGGSIALDAGDCFALGDGVTDGSTFGVSTIDPVDLSLDEDNWSFRIGANYDLPSGGLLYATVSQGYKAGVFSNIGASSISQYQPAQQEKLISYEGGFKLPLADRRLQLNGAAFYYDYSDKQIRAKVLDPIFSLLERLINVPKSRVWGVEGEIAARPFDGLTFSGSATYINSKVTDSFSTFNGVAIYNTMGFTGDFQGSELPFTPNFMANADIQYDWEMGTVRPFVGGTFVYQGQSNATFENEVLRADFFEIPAWETLDLRAGVSTLDDRWRFTVYGRNVFNKYYLVAPTYYHDAFLTTVGRPAVYGASIAFSY